MSSENGRFIGIGVALVDNKFDGIKDPPSLTREEIIAFLENNRPSMVRAGGPLPNTFSAIAHFTEGRELKLFHCVGADERGTFFQRETDPRIGVSQIHPTEPTGVWVGFNDERGNLKFGRSNYGVALKVRAKEEELEAGHNGIFVTDISSCKNEDINHQAEVMLDRLEQEGGIFVLSLGGARPSSLDRMTLDSVLASFRYKPQAVFANKDEFQYVTQAEEGIEEGMLKAFPDARLLVVTLGSAGSFVRFEGNLTPIPPFEVEGIGDEVANAFDIPHIDFRTEPSGDRKTQYAGITDSAMRMQVKFLAQTTIDDTVTVEGKNALVIDDMVTTGVTAAYMNKVLYEKYHLGYIAGFCLIDLVTNDPSREEFINRFLIVLGDVESLVAILNDGRTRINRHTLKTLYGADKYVLDAITPRLLPSVIERLAQARDMYYFGIRIT